FIPKNIETGSKTAQLYFKKQPSAVVIRNIETKVEGIIEELKLEKYQISREEFYDVKTNYAIQPIKFTESGKEEDIDQGKTVIGFVFGLLIYLFIFLYGVQVMRGVMEEKTSRIVEVIISSVKPFQLMMGKIIGVALVGLTQIVVWIVLTFTIVMAVQMFILPEILGIDTTQIQATEEVLQEMNQGNSAMPQEFDFSDPNSILKRTNWTMMLGLFLFYFLGGYLLYSALFAAVGAAVDNEADSQQFMFPVTAPLILAYVMSTVIIQNPEGPAAFWFSIIPFTSPIVMLVRVAIGVGDGGIPIWEVALSMSLLVVTFIFVVWLAGRIYRTGILMYGKKISYKELWKWIRY
ncbi:ABC transporter permease, partial [Salibacteraceae bacterium]|nr:ABC transporter permease [Salibacteraceae bacterium]